MAAAAICGRRTKPCLIRSFALNFFTYLVIDFRGLLPVGIEPADPMIHFRDKAYPVSYDRRHAEEIKK
jgi:hypothetical protein